MCSYICISSIIITKHHHMIIMDGNIGNGCMDHQLANESIIAMLWYIMVMRYKNTGSITQYRCRNGDDDSVAHHIYLHLHALYPNPIPSPSSLCWNPLSIPLMMIPRILIEYIAVMICFIIWYIQSFPCN